MALPKKYDFNDYDNYLTDANPTTSAEAQDYFRNMDSLVDEMVEVFLWQPETNYANGDVVKSSSMPNGAEAVCVSTNGGKSSNVEPQWGNVGGANVADGTCFWHLRYNVTSVNGIEADNKGNIQLPVMQGSTNVSAGASGLAPAPPATSNELFLSNDGTYKEAGKVKSVNGQTGDVVVDTLPVGTIISYAGNTTPNGFLDCNGASLNPATYVNLFNEIGTTYGGNGSTTFNLPNLNNNSFLEGSDTVGTVKSAGLPNITGRVGNAATSGYLSGAFYSTSGASLGWYGEDGYNQYFDASRSNSIYGKSTTVQPKSVTVKFCIKY